MITKISSLSDYSVGTVLLRCEDHCEALFIDKYKWGLKKDSTDEWEVVYDIAIVDKHSVDTINTIRSRIKNALRMLFSKPIYYTSIYIEDEQKIIEFRDALTRLIEMKDTNNIIITQKDETNNDKE